MANTTIKITQLPNIGNGLAANTLLPVVNTAGTAVTEKVTVGNIANYVLTEAGNTLPAAFVSQIAYSVANSDQSNITRLGNLTELYISDVSTLHVPGGNNGDVLQTNGDGNLNWTAMSGAGNGSPGGANSQIQFNDNGLFSGSSLLTWDAGNGQLNTVKIAASDAIIYGNIDVININATGNVSSENVYTNNFTANTFTTTGNLSAEYFIGNGSQLTGITATAVAGGPNTAIQYNIDGEIVGSAEFVYDVANTTLSVPIITSTGNITGGNISTTGTVSAGNISATHLSGEGGNISNVGNVDHANTSNLATYATTANSVSVANVVGIGNIAILSLSGSSSNVLYGNGVFAPTSNANTGNIAFSGTDIYIANGSPETKMTVGPNVEGWTFLQLPTDATANVTNTRLTNDAGNVEIATGDFSTGSNSYSWVFKNDSNLVTPGNISVNGKQSFWAYSPSGLTVTANVENDVNGVSMEDGVDTYVYAGTNVVIESSSSNSSYDWIFDNTGNLSVPGNILVSLSASPAPYISGFNSITTSNGGNLGGVVFDLGNIVFPDSNIHMSNGYVLSTTQDIGGQIDTSTYTVGYSADNAGTAAIYARNAAGQGDNNAVVLANAISGKVTITAANVALNNQVWTFDGSGNMTLPANTLNINYNNGSAVFGNIVSVNKDGSSSNVLYGNGVFAPVIASASIANGTSNITIPAANGNVVTAVGGATILTAYSGGIKVGGSGILQSPGGASSITLNNNGANIPTANITTFANVTGASGLNVVANANIGNIGTGGLITATGNIQGGNLISVTDVYATGNVWANSGVLRTISTTANVFNSNATTVNIAGGASVVLNIGNSAGTTNLAGNVQGNTNGFAIGYLNIPQLSFAGNTTLALTDAGKHYYSTLSTANTLTIPNNASVTFSTGTTINIVNQGTGNMTIAQGTGVSMYLAGNSTSGNRTLTTYGVASITKVATDTWFISGVGLV